MEGGSLRTFTTSVQAILFKFAKASKPSGLPPSPELINSITIRKAIMRRFPTNQTITDQCTTFANLRS